MRHFANLLKKTGERLGIPEPSRTRILLEMASDLEDSYQHHVDQGCEPAEATRRAEQAFGASEESLRLLERIHRSGFDDLSHRFSQHVGTLWSKVLLVAILVFEILLAFRILTDHYFLFNPSPFLWPIAALALAIFVFTVWKLKQIYSYSGAAVRRLRTGLAIPLFFAGASLAVAMLGFLFHLQRFFRLNADGAPESLIMNFAGWMISISSLMTVGLLTAILAALVWFVLSRLVGRSESREIESLIRTAV